MAASPFWWPGSSQRTLFPYRPGSDKAKVLCALVVKSGVREVVAVSVFLHVIAIAASVLLSA